jgi:signal transduction histidine kinase
VTCNETLGVAHNNGNVREFTWFLLGSLSIAVGVSFLGTGLTTETVAAASLAGCIIALYWFLGRRALRLRDGRLGVQFLLAAIVLAGIMFQIHPVYMTSLFGLYPLCFAAVQQFRSQVAVSGLLSLASVLGQANDGGWTRGAWFAGSMIGAVSFFFAVVLGRWIASMKDVTIKQEQLISELTTTRSQLATAQREVGKKAERERLSAEIHDTLAQGFSSILMLSRSAERSVGSMAIQPGADASANKLKSLLFAISECAHTNLAEARSFVEDLAPPVLQHGTLSEAITRLTSNFQTEHGVLTKLNIFGEPSVAQLEPGEHVVILRALQESLTNVGRHAQATSVTVELRFDASPVTVRIIDNGIGFAPDEALKPGQHGLNGLRNRLAQVGGSVNISSSPGNGTEVTVSL